MPQPPTPTQGKPQPPQAPQVIDARFETSAADEKGWPAEGPLEVAFVGRSNVGKSSLLNTLAQRKGLARTSSEPGRTRLVNFFQVDLRTSRGEDVAVRLVDLPGFGYAKVSKSERATWRPAIERYLSGRKTLRAAVLLIDARRVPEKPDADPDALLDERELFTWIGSRGVTVIPVLTKCDKLAKHERVPVAERLRKGLGSRAPIVLFSALSGDGRDKLLTRLTEAVLAAADDDSSAQSLTAPNEAP